MKNYAEIVAKREEKAALNKKEHERISSLSREDGEKEFGGYAGWIRARMGSFENSLGVKGRWE